MLTAISLFAGVGGFDLALQRAGVRVTAAVEIDKAARRVLAARFPDTVLFSDVREVTGGRLLATGFTPEQGIVTAGWPCTGNSVAGRRRGLDDDGSGLWSEVRRLLAELRPAWFIGENVRGLLSVNQGTDFAQIVDDLAELGMGFAWRVFDARYFGVAQRRRRLLVVGHAGGSPDGPREVLLEPGRRGVDPAPGGQAAQDVAGTLGGGTGSRGWCNDLDRMTFLPVVEPITGPIVASALTSNMAGAGGGVDDNTAQAWHIVPAGVGVRRLTPTECERLQGFPDGWTDVPGCSDAARYRQMGNAVPVPLAEWVTRRIRRASRNPDGDIPSAVPQDRHDAASERVMELLAALPRGDAPALVPATDCVGERHREVSDGTAVVVDVDPGVGQSTFPREVDASRLPLTAEGASGSGSRRVGERG
ncbi:DNA cytosine methyltransferase [Nonomuraea sp. NPDC050663]|uniref:DNA cytosine methyltransferase n=1 Tax=Nonomuraea sp. NPDC050663 TaxID=3364370 RepID=UPI0037B69A2A